MKIILKHFIIIIALIVFNGSNFFAQKQGSDIKWIRPNDNFDEAVWGIEGGIVIGLWPSPIEIGKNSTGGPRGLFRIGYQAGGKVHHINYIAVEPVVDGEMEFSEISPSRVDETWGKMMWASENENPGSFSPAARTRGEISNPDSENPEVEELSFYVFMEKFKNGAHPYFRVSIRSDKPEEIGFEIFHQDNSAEMERCVLTATMGNYARARNLYLKDEIVNSKELYTGYEEIDFIEKEEYGKDRIIKNKGGEFIAIIESDEDFAELAAWPQEKKYFQNQNWRYRPFFKVVQYWKKDSQEADNSLRIRVNGRATYWAGGSSDESNYIAIPRGPAFENFELREDYEEGQQFYFGISRKNVEELIAR
ncbi:hypothetical protein [Salegentibacter sp. T436]|uniref:hypothetical protein n=1 Tax=Salegentibacter sp. T436 TaxID=1729720 RepID=UPI00094A6EFA|nr:hypothetical protein [Salegentibacter sp. T436]APS40557.1 hypothetical protein AO058_17480 [Salegentibacter sp. T436]